MLSLKPKHLKRYRDIARLLIRYGRSDLVQQVGLHEAFEGDSQPTTSEDVAEAEELASDLEQLGPTFIKLGQLLSTRPDLLPPPYLNALARLQDHVEPFPFEQVERIVTTELGTRLDRLFTTFDRTPLASASLSQVHRATLVEGSPVVVKVQRAGIRERIVDDLDVLHDLAEWADHYTDIGRRYELGQLLDTLRRAILRELDFRNEAQNLVTLRHNLRKFKLLVVPNPIDELTTSRVLTMDYLPGRKISSLSPGELTEKERRELAQELFRAYLHQVLVDGFFHADPHPGNLTFTPDRRIGIFDLGMVVRVPPRLQENLVKLLLCIADGRGEEAAAVAVKMGQNDRDFNRADFRRRITRLVTDSQGTTIKTMHMGHVVLEIRSAAAECGVHLPDEITMISKTLLHLEETLCTLDSEFNMNEEIQERTTEIMQRRAREQMSLQSAYHTLLEVNEFATLLPERLNKIMDLIAENELRVHVDAIDEAQLIQGIQKIANRITMGTVLAALIIGAALMVDAYPAIAMAFFVAAGAGAVSLMLQILLRDRHDK